MVFNKKAIELQINFIIMLIIAIVVFGMGIKIASNMFTDATELKDSLDQDTENAILEHLNKGKVLTIGINRKEIESGKSDVFAMGLINKYGEPIEFIVKVRDDFIARDRNNEDIELAEYEIDTIDKWTFPERGPFTLENNEKMAVPLAFAVPNAAPDGLYSFTVEVWYDSTLEGSVNTNEATGNKFNNQVLKVYIEVN